MILTTKRFNLTQDAGVEQHLETLRRLGFGYSSFGFKDLTTGKVVGCFSDREWADLYVSESLFSYDPLLQTACAIANCTILWSAVSIDSCEGYQVMMKRQAISGAGSGLTLAINDGKFQEIVALGDCDSEDLFLDRFMQRFHQIVQARALIKTMLLETQ